MKKLLTIFLSFLWLFIFSKPFQQQENEINLIGKVERIDSTRNSYVIYIKGKTGKGIFSIPKTCGNQGNYKYKLQKGKLYSFKLKKSISMHMPEHQPKEHIDKELIDDQIIWTSKMKSTFYEDCLNMCGLYIDNDGKSKQCKK